MKGASAPVCAAESLALREAAQARLESFSARIVVTGLLTLIAGAVVGIADAHLITAWLATVLLTQGIERRLSQRMCAVGDAITRSQSWLYLGAIAAAVVAYVSMAPLLWLHGGGAGQIAALLFLAGGLIHVSLSTFVSRPLYLCSVSPYFAVLFVLVVAVGPADDRYSAAQMIAILITFCGFVFHFLKATALQQIMHARTHKALEEAEAARLNAEQRQIEAETANTAKSQFLANMSHELRTPLNAIIGYTEIMLEDAEDGGRDGDAKDHHRVLGAARRLLHLINDVLDMSKIESGRMEIEIAEIDPAQLARDAIDTIRPQAEANGNAMRLHLEPGLPLMRTDGFKLGQCLLNLLSNAAKFTHNGEIEVRVSAAPDGAEVVFEVRDTGIGIAPENLASVFTPFKQAEASTAREFGGTGLGLAISRSIAQLLRGDITVQSAPKVGSTFRLTAATDLSLNAEAPVWTEGQAGAGLVLVIDDDPSARDLATRALKRVNLDVRCAATAAAGLALARELRPALIIIDINLPDASGFELIGWLNDEPAAAATPKLVISVVDDRPRAIAAGACDHLLKPVDRDRLAAAALRYVRPSTTMPDNAPSPIYQERIRQC